MNGYLNIKEQQKATKVRKLVKEKLRLKLHISKNNLTGGEIKILKGGIKNLQNEADKLSLELVDYLKQNYPNDFLIKMIEWEDKDIGYFNYLKVENKEQLKVFKMKMSEYGKQFSKYNFLFFDHLYAKYTIFKVFRRTIFKMGEINNILQMPSKFYQFMEEMGLTKRAVMKLYDFKELEKLPYHPLINIIINYPINHWPNRVKINEKLI